ncbi:hypothetical protein Tco_0010038, partial [Tanacetum coccineum]
DGIIGELQNVWNVDTLALCLLEGMISFNPKYRPTSEEISYEGGVAAIYPEGMLITSNWKNKSLTYAGRLMLVASVLESIHVYWALVFLLPVGVINDINKLPKNFLCNQNDGVKCKANEAWKNVCKAKQKGGLRLKDLNVWDKAMIVKHLWHILINKESLWIKWINTEKLKGRSVWEVNEDKNDSWGWKTIMSLRNDVTHKMVTKLGDGDDTLMWYDNWSNIGTLD